MRYQWIMGGLIGLMFAGCLPDVEKEMDKAAKQSIVGKTTQEIGEYDPESGEVEADLQVDSGANPLAAATGGYKFAAATLAKQAVERSLQLFHAEHERYPKDHAEFMEVIIKRNQLELPVLPGKRRYQYDVANHELKIMEAAEEAQK